MKKNKRISADRIFKQISYKRDIENMQGTLIAITKMRRIMLVSIHRHLDHEALDTAEASLAKALRRARKGLENLNKKS